MHTIKHKLHAVCGNDIYRPAFSYIEFQGGFAYATDAHVAVIVDLTDVFGCDYDTTRLLDGYRIHRNVWRMLIGKRVEIKEQGTLMFSPTAKEWPSLILKLDETEAEMGRAVADKITSVFPKIQDAQPLQHIGVNPALFKRAADACRFEYNQARLTFFGPNKAILMDDKPGVSKSMAIVLPVMLSN
jgi:hypothetical protein